MNTKYFRLFSFLGMSAISLTVSSILCNEASAILPPYYQRNREFQEILNSQAVTKAVHENPVDSIRYVGPDKYQILSQRCTVNIELEGTAMNRAEGWVGPREFTVKVVSTEACN